MKNLSKVLIVMSVATLVLIFGYTNCGDSTAVFDSESQKGDVTASGGGNGGEGVVGQCTRFMLDLADYENLVDELRATNDDEANVEADRLEAQLNRVKNLIDDRGRNLDCYDNAVLVEKDSLDNYGASGERHLMFLDYDGRIKALDAKYEDLKDSLGDLWAKFTTLEKDYKAFKSNIETRMDIAEAAIEQLKDDVIRIDNVLAGLDDRFVSISVYKTAIDQINEDIGKLQGEMVTALEGMNANTALLDEMLQAEASVPNLNNLVCEYKINEAKDGKEEINGRVMCDDISMYDGDNYANSCCYDVADLPCGEIFNSVTTDKEGNVVNLQNSSLQNCYAYTQSIGNSNDLIDKLIADNALQQEAINTLNTQVLTINQTLAKIDIEFINKLKAYNIFEKIEGLETRMGRAEFKLGILSSIGAMQELNELQKAWLFRRNMDVRAQFCSARPHYAFNRANYESARHNWVYCVERLKWIAEANELIALNASFLGHLQSISVDGTCSATVNGKAADQLSFSELSDLATFDKLYSQCKTGETVAIGLVLQIIGNQARISPDFRTVAHMETKDAFVQKLYFNGKQASELSTADVNAFQNIDPTHANIKDSYYGRIERVFVKNYVDYTLRNTPGNQQRPGTNTTGYITSPQKVKIPAAFGRVFNYDQIDKPATQGAWAPYLKDLRKLEIIGTNAANSCAGECGFQVTGRNKTDRDGGKRYSYPIDGHRLCPVHNDSIVTKGKDGKYYAYRVRYTRYRGATEYLYAQFATRNGHRPVANSAADVKAGRFASCGYTPVRNTVDRNGTTEVRLNGRLVLGAVRPYGRTHNQPNCQRFVFHCLVKSDEFEYNGAANETNMDPTIWRTLSWEDPAFDGRLARVCRTLVNSGADDQDGNADKGYLDHNKPAELAIINKTIVENPLLKIDQTRLLFYYGKQSAADMTSFAGISDNTTQLTENYWMYNDNNIQYGVNDQLSGKSTPFYAPTLNGATSSPLFRRYHNLWAVQGLAKTIQFKQCAENAIQ